MKTKPKLYESEAITVTFDLARCIHAEECIHGLPGVFEKDRRPWVDPSQASADEVAAVVARCPTGALRFGRNDGGAAESAPAENIIALDPNGPLYVHGELHVVRPDGTVVVKDTRVALCRCGASENKPFCDGAHTKAGFADDGTMKHCPSAADEAETGELTVTVAPNGPLILKGPYRVAGEDGFPLRVKGALCRCGLSERRPFCDGTHGREGFTAE